MLDSGVCTPGKAAIDWTPTAIKRCCFNSIQYRQKARAPIAMPRLDSAAQPANERRSLQLSRKLLISLLLAVPPVFALPICSARIRCYNPSIKGGL